MNAMGHQVENFIGLSERVLSSAVEPAWRRGPWRWGRGMADMGEMSMPLPPNTLPMMTGTGQFGPIEMGGNVTVMKGAGEVGAQRLTRTRAPTRTRQERSLMK